MKLWLDDVRPPWLYGHVGWDWAPTANDAIVMLRTGLVERASLDHDLTAMQTIGRDDGEPTGYDVVCWMRDHGVWPPGGVEVHSQNERGKARMLAVIQAHYAGGVT